MSSDFPYDEDSLSSSSLYDEDYRISNEPFYRKNILRWASYDLGNTIFSMAVVSLAIAPLVFILYFNQGMTGEEAIKTGNYSIAAVLLVGNLIMAVFSPFLGAYSDQLPKRNGLLMRISIFCILLMASLVVSAFEVNVWVILIIFLFSNLFYQMGLVVYDSMLPFVTDEDSVGRVSGIGIALGYLGSFIAIGIGYALIPIFGDFFTQPAKDGNPDNFVLGYLPYLFPIAALMFFLFSIPMYKVIEKEKKIEKKPLEELTGEVVWNVKKTAYEIFWYKDMLLFLIGWLIFVDAANTVILYMTPIAQIGLEFGESSVVLMVLAIGIGSAVLFTFFVGRYVDKHGPRKGLLFITTLWLVSLIVGYFTNLEINGVRTPEWPVYIFPIGVGVALGGTWVVQRQYITELSPPEKIGNYFGFANIFGRISAAVGPYIWAVSVEIFNEDLGYNINMATRNGILVLGVLMIIGFLIMYFGVRDPHKAYIAGGRANGKGQWIKSNGEEIQI